MSVVAAYSGRFDGDSRSLKLKMDVPSAGNAVLTFDHIHFIETETNFNSRERDIRVVTDFDLGYIVINGVVKEELRTISGDTNADTLNDTNPACAANRVLALRLKLIDGTVTDAERTEFAEKAAVCRVPTWLKKSIDLSAFRGQEVEVELRYVTDAGYTEFGIVIDNFELGGEKIDFESSADSVFGKFVRLEEGSYGIDHNQFYLMEYRTPGEDTYDGQSYNMDSNIRLGTQSMFVANGRTPLEQFRMVTIDYQPGLLVWYFNSRFDRQSNSPGVQDGKGYLLVVNSKVKEMPLPGILGSPELFDSEGFYDTESPVFKNFAAEQRRKFICFSAIEYYTYINGEAPNCADMDESMHNKLRDLTFDGRSLVARREGFNEFLPIEQFDMWGVGLPMRQFAGFRTGLSTFRPATAEAFAPFTVYKEQSGQLVQDDQLTAAAATFAPVDSFSDADSVLHEREAFRGDTVVVERKGFGV